MAVDTRARLHDLNVQLHDYDAIDTVAYIEGLIDDDEPLTEEELSDARSGLAEIRRGEYVTLDEIQRRARERFTRFAFHREPNGFASACHRRSASASTTRSMWSRRSRTMTKPRC